MIDSIKDIIKVTLETPVENWFSYRYDVEGHRLDRLSFHWNNLEIQMNYLIHSKRPHCHACNMLSLMLVNGYNWHLQQYGASIPVELFSAPGSIIRMDGKDTHWIEESNKYSISLCIFDKTTDWHEYYPALEASFKLDIFSQAIDGLKTHFKDYIE